MKTTRLLLTSENIDVISQDTADMLTASKVRRQEVIKARLSIESVLLNLQSRFGEDVEIEFSMGKKWFRPCILVALEEERFDPVHTKDDEFQRWSSSFIQSLSPEYLYRGGKNIVRVRLNRPKVNPLVRIAIAFALAVVLGLAGSLLPYDTRKALLEGFITPMYQKFIGVLDFVTVPFIFLSVLCGICGLGNAGEFSSFGKKLVARYVGLTLFGGCVAAAVFTPVFHLTLYGKNNVGDALKSSWQMLLDIIPDNILSPFTEGNILQIILIASILALVLMALGERGKTAATVMQELDRGIIYVTGLVDKTIPFFVVLVVVNQMWNASLKDYTSAIKPMLVFAAFSVLFFALTVLYTSARMKINPLMFLKKMFPVLLIGISTASSSAIHGENVSTCTSKLGINPKVTDFAIPIGMVSCVPFTAVNFLVMAIFSAERFNVEVSLIWLITAVIVSVILAVATPPVAGGAIACYTLLFAQLGIPAEALALAVTIDFFFDFISTTLDNALIQTQLLLQAREGNVLDRKILDKGIA